METLIRLSYIVASVLFIFGLKMLSSPKTARRGNMLSALGMLIAVVGTLMTQGLRFEWILAGVIAGAVIGVIAAIRVPMTSMPEFVALFNGFGGVASLLVAWAEFQRSIAAGDEAVAGVLPLSWQTAIPIFLASLIGGVTFTGSAVAFGKLSGKLDSKPMLFKGQRFVNAGLMAALVACGVLFAMGTEADSQWVSYFPFLAVVAGAFVLGVLATVPIGGADMPVVISLLNSYSGLAACAAGFIIQNTVLIVSGSLVGASGIVLTQIMCKAMNRSLANVLFSGFGASSGDTGAGVEGEATSMTPSDAYYVLEAAGSVVFVPGYGMAVAQAQHAVHELAQILESNGAEVRFAIHPVAGRMPGHMNVLLAEANVPYEQLAEMEDVNPTMDTVDVAIVIGANDVVNPAALEDEASPIYGMPIIEVTRAGTVFVLKRSLGSGFAGVPNPLFYKDNTQMIFGDAKQTIQALIAEFKE